MKKNIKIGSIAVLSAAVLVSSGIYIGQKVLKDKNQDLNTEESSNTKRNDEDLKFNVTSYNNHKNSDDEQKKEDEKKTEVLEEEDKEKVDEKDTVGEEKTEEKTESKPSNNKPETKKEEEQVKPSGSVVNGIDQATRESISEFIYNQDGDYIHKTEGNWKTKMNLQPKNICRADEELINTVQFLWGINAVNCYSVVATDARQEYVDNSINYIVNLDTGKLYILPNQGGMDAYEVNSNKVVTSYSYQTSESSVKWR